MTKLILFEDDFTMSALLKTLFELERVEVKSFNGDEVQDLVKMLRDEHPDVILLDVFLHQMNGLDLLHRIRQEPEFNELKIVMTSGMDYREKSLNAGATAFIQKPYMPDEVLKIVKNQ